MPDSYLHKVQSIIIPQISCIRNCGPLRSILVFPIFPESEGESGLTLDFFDVNAMDHITDGYQTKCVVIHLFHNTYS